MRKWLLACGLAIGTLAPMLRAQSVPSIVVGNDVLLPNWPTAQKIQINVTGGQQVDGLALNAEIADGGTSNGGMPGPSFTAADLITNTIFANNNAGQNDNIGPNQPFPFPAQWYSGNVITAGASGDSTVPANGLLATMSISTAGIGPGIYSLKLARFSNTATNGDTALGVDSNFNTVYPTVTNGNLVVLYPGDADEDGIVNLADLLTLVRNFGKTNATWTMGDTNGDGVVNLADFLNLSRNFGKSINLNPAAPALAAALASPASVPEPAALGLITLASLALCRRKRA